jgi:hypothetical protein
MMINADDVLKTVSFGFRNEPFPNPACQQQIVFRMGGKKQRAVFLRTGG